MFNAHRSTDTTLCDDNAIVRCRNVWQTYFRVKQKNTTPTVTCAIHLNHTNKTGIQDDDSKKKQKQQQRLEDLAPARGSCTTILLSLSLSA
ncbi:unnamed protein product [Macrosiphum euphorbiae]|uniref:Uncharacterized protein n=1 Tax=Macrosiphum euphorbiae TaxID=13131 RepID=A0AAV0VXJ1_9HEMI|nr:unnamed protein product [Macrosiphum euphorbiae]